MTNKHHHFIHKLAVLFITVSFFSMQSIAQKNVKGIKVNKQRSDVLLKGFKKVDVYDIDVSDVAKHAKGNGKSTFDLTLELAGKAPFAMTITETNLLADDYKLIVADGDARQMSNHPNCKTYAGTLTNDASSAVFLTISDKTIFGFIKSGNKQYHIEPLRYFEQGVPVSNFVFYEAADVLPGSGQTCGVTELDEKVAALSGKSIQPLGEASGLCKVTDVGIASDRGMVNKYGSAALVEEHNISVMNMVVGFYRNAQIGTGYLAFRIRAQYVSLNTTSDPLRPAYNGRDADSLLINFSRWAVQTGFSSTPDLLQLWTTRDFGKFVGPGPADYNYGVIGLAFLDAVCKANLKFQILEAYTGLAGMSLGILAAHEIGHNFGARHDGDGNIENSSSFIMASSLNPNVTEFSNTSLLAMTNYTNTVSCLQSCSGVIIPQFNASPAALCTGGNVAFTNATVSDVPLSLATVWRFPGGNPATSTAVSPTVNYATPGLKTATLEVGNKTITKEIFVSNSPTQACRTLTPRNSDLSGLMSFSLGSIGYKATNVIINGEYKDFACSLNTRLTLGNTYTIISRLGFPSVTPISSRLQIFLDYNNDGDFLDANEMLYTGSNCISGTDTVQFTAPPSVSLLDTWLRLRVVAAPCNVANSDGCALSGNAGIFDFAVAFERPPDCVLYVNANATGNNDGSSWANAFTNVQSAITAANCFYGNQIWVARGTYKPTSGTNRDAAFTMKNKVAIYGGFIGNETQLTQRNWRLNQTILSGDIGVQNDINDNAYHVIFNNANGLDSTAILDGFIVRDGNAFKGEYFGNRGGGIHNFYTTPSFFNCVFTNNNAAEYGGAMFNESSSVKLVNCVFAGNTAWYGGGLYNEAAATEIVNCTFSGNQVTFTGAAMYTFGAVSPKVTNSIIWGNGSGIQNAGGATPIVTSSIVQGGYIGSGNLNVDPLFVQQLVPGLGNAGNLRLKPCSPAINTGDNLAFPTNLTTDLAGTQRVLNLTIDRGAYETALADSLVLYVNAAAPAGGDGASWATALRSLQDALVVEYCSYYKQIWVAKGTYTPTSNSNRDSAFVMRNNLAVYGGFAGTETLLSNRNWRTNVTILSGDIGVLNNRNDNTYNVVRNDNNGLDSTAILDGFTVTGGNANKGNYVGSVGAGIFNRGGSAVYSNCVLTGNQASIYGGGFFSETGTPLLINSIVAGNTAQFGAGLYNESATTNIVNCTFAGNLASNSGGGLYSYGLPVATMHNCVVWSNSSGVGFSTINSSSPVVSSSIVQGDFAGTGNLNTNPFFTNPPLPGLGSIGDLRLLPCSPAINAGSSASVPTGYNFDVGAFPRLASTKIDMGAYERQILNIPTAIYVDANATGRNDGYDWPNAFTSLQSAFNALNLCSQNGFTIMFLGEGIFTAPANIPFEINKLNTILRGGYSKGGTVYTPSSNPAIIKGELRVLKSVTLENIRVEKQ